MTHGRAENAENTVCFSIAFVLYKTLTIWPVRINNIAQGRAIPIRSLL
jgi:hypothetical protein